MLYVYLQFNDLVLICTVVAVVIGSKQRYRIKSKIDIDGMQVARLVVTAMTLRGRRLS